MKFVYTLKITLELFACCLQNGKPEVKKENSVGYEPYENGMALNKTSALALFSVQVRR